jgi:uncharacterized membrane protein YphA (DoxX/SURF4 family)
LILAAVLTAAGTAKLRDRPGTAQAVRDFGLPDAVAATIALLLPLAELVVALALLVPATARWGAVAALVLLVAFSTVIVLSLRRGERPDCHCFGGVSSSPIGPRTLLRNGALAGLAILVAVGGPGQGIELAGSLTELSLAELALGAGGVLILGLVALRIGFAVRARRRGAEASSVPAAHAPKLALGSRAPSFELQTLAGGVLGSEELLRPGLPVMLVFVDPDCGPCTALLPSIVDWQRSHSDQLTVAVIGRGELERNRLKLSEHEIAWTGVEPEGRVSEAYGVIGTPSAIALYRDGSVASTPAGGADAIEALLRRSLGQSESSAEAPSRPQPAPALDRLEELADGWAEGLSRRRALGQLGAFTAALVVLGPMEALAGSDCPCPGGRRCCRGRCCKKTFVCRKGRCRCPRGKRRCGQRCRDLRRDRRNCGACGHRCPEGQACVNGACSATCPAGQTNCSGTCVDTNTSASHCGNCGHACGNGMVCVNGACTTTCEAGETSCGGTCVDTQIDSAHCGACGALCATPNGVASCEGGVCYVVCDPGFVDCDGTCVATGSDVNHCGGCAPCAPLPNATVGCVGGACYLAGCNAGYGDCNGIPADGCETNLSTTANCGGCGNNCAAQTNNKTCVNYNCGCNSLADCSAIQSDTCSSNQCMCGAGPPCPGGQTCLGGACV